MQDIYSQAFVRSLFNEMSATYGLVNLIASFGFCARWRQQCVAQVTLHATDTIFDLMSGMGELWPSIARHLSEAGVLYALDFSPQMCERAQRTAQQLTPLLIQVIEEDVLQNSIPAHSADVILSSFGLKTFNSAQQQRLAQEVARILRPHGRFAFLEISVPPLWLLRWPFLFHLHYIVPLLGRLFLGNPDNYRMLGIYTQQFQHCGTFMRYCGEAGLLTRPQRFFGGCATGVSGEKPGPGTNESAAGDRPFLAER